MSLLVDIKKSFGGFKLDVGFEIKDEVMALLGASGCGKSMTLKCIAGIVRPDSGVIVADGRALFDSNKGVNIPPQRRNIGMLFQSYALFPNMTVTENIMSVLTRSEKNKNGAGRLRSLVSRFYLNGLENHYPRQLSGGQQQRAALARIMASEPSVIMLDEPLSALDSYLRWQLELELIQTLEEFGGTTLYVSHNRDEVYRMSRKVCPMTGGHARNVCGTKELFETPSSLTACLLSGCKNYSRAEKKGETRLFAKDWGTELASALPISNDINFIGVRAHCMSIADNGACKKRTESNIVRCRVQRVIEDLLSVTISVLPIGADPKRDFSNICIELPPREAHGIKAGDAADLVIKPENIILLNK